MPVHARPALSPANAGEWRMGFSGRSAARASSTGAQKDQETRRPWESAHLHPRPETPCDNSHGSSANTYEKVFVLYLFPYRPMTERGSYHSFNQNFPLKTFFGLAAIKKQMERG